MTKTAIESILTNKGPVQWVRWGCLIVLAGIVSSCLRDKDQIGTETYDHVLAVEGISTETYTLYLGDRFECRPQVTFSKGADESDFEYRWMVGKSQVISRDLHLDWEISLPDGYATGTVIPGVLVVTNIRNGLEFRETFEIQVLSGYTPSYITVYETGKGTVEWISLQGTPDNFTRSFPDMVERVNGTEAIEGYFKGALYSTNELAVFTDHSPDYGACISMRNADAEAGFYHNLGELMGDIRGRVYQGHATELDIKDVTFGYGASKYLICNNTLHVFNGLERKLPLFDERTYVKADRVEQAISSKQFMRYKKATFVRMNDNTVGCFHVYNDEMETIKVNGEPFRLDQLCGAFSEATGLGSNKPYHIYLIGKKDGLYNLYDFYVNYIGTKVQPIVLNRVIPMPEAGWMEQVRHWFGSFGENYGFYATAHDIYKFDYYEMKEFVPSSAPMISFPEEYEITDVFVQIAGSGLRDEDDCTVVLLYNRQKNTSTLYIYDTVSGRRIKEYPDIIPGKAVYFVKKT